MSDYILILQRERERERERENILNQVSSFVRVRYTRPESMIQVVVVVATSATMLAGYAVSRCTSETPGYVSRSVRCAVVTRPGYLSARAELGGSVVMVTYCRRHGIILLPAWICSKNYWSSNFSQHSIIPDIILYCRQ